MNFKFFQITKFVLIFLRNRKLFLLMISSFSLFFLFACEDGEQKRQKETETADLFLLTISYLRSQGNCKVTEKSSPTDTFSCNRKPNGLCNSNDRIITSSDLTKIIKETRDFSELYPNCVESIGQSGLFNIKITTDTETDEILSKYIYETVPSCEEIGLILSPNESLANLEEILFLESPKGKIGRAANILKNFVLSPQTTKDNANICLLEGFSESERILLQNFHIGNLLLSKNL